MAGKYDCIVKATQRPWPEQDLGQRETSTPVTDDTMLDMLFGRCATDCGLQQGPEAVESTRCDCDCEKQTGGAGYTP